MSKRAKIEAKPPGERSGTSKRDEPLIVIPRGGMYEKITRILQETKADAAVKRDLGKRMPFDEVLDLLKSPDEQEGIWGIQALNSNIEILEDIRRRKPLNYMERTELTASCNVLIKALPTFDMRTLKDLARDTCSMHVCMIILNHSKLPREIKDIAEKTIRDI